MSSQPFKPCGGVTGWFLLVGGLNASLQLNHLEGLQVGFGWFWLVGWLVDVLLVGCFVTA